MARVHYLMFASAAEARDWLSALRALGVRDGCGGEALLRGVGAPQDADAPLDSTFDSTFDLSRGDASLSLDGFGHRSSVWTRQGGRVILNCRRLYFPTGAHPPGAHPTGALSSGQPTAPSIDCLPLGASPTGQPPPGPPQNVPQNVPQKVPQNVPQNVPQHPCELHPCDLAADLLARALQLREAEPLSSPRLVAFLDAAAALKTARVESLSESERLAFFLNTYHALVQHAYTLLGPPTSSSKAISFFNTIAYQVSYAIPYHSIPYYNFLSVSNTLQQGHILLQHHRLPGEQKKECRG